MESGNTKTNLGWPTLEERRLQTKLTTFQKCRLGHIDLPTDHLILKKRQTRLGGDGPTYQKMFSKIDSHIYSFYPHTTSLWNQLPSHVRLNENIESFNTQIKSLDLTALKQKICVV